MHVIKNPRRSGGENVLVHQVLQGGHEGLLTLNDYFKLGLFVICLAGWKAIWTNPCRWITW
ncbi:hypothetical protein ACJ8PQ_20510, partial [Serratia sp. CY74664]|uniref:hypothetical protein n=1 Tax=Serratia sp. CY74664 TaxID=3383676 RepID=UPI003FA09FF6